MSIYEDEGEGEDDVDMFSQQYRLLTNWPIECKQSKQCAPAKHHFDDCVERVQQQETDGEVKEDCVEECKSWHTTTDIHTISLNVKGGFANIC